MRRIRWSLAVLLTILGTACNKGGSGTPDKPGLSAPKSRHIEKQALTLSFVRTVDCSPILIAKAKGYFEEQGLSVRLVAADSWEDSAGRIASNQVDGGAVLASQPVASASGATSTSALVSPVTLCRDNGAIFLSEATWHQVKGRIRRDTEDNPVFPLEADFLGAAGDPMSFTIDAPYSPLTLALRYWLAASDMAWPNCSFVTGKDSLVATRGAVSSAPMDEAHLATPLHDIWRGCPTASYVCTIAWAEANPRTLTVLSKALLQAGQWLDASETNRREAAKLLAGEEMLGAMGGRLVASLTGSISERRSLPYAPVFFRYRSGEPRDADAVWFLTQMARWGLIRGKKEDAWFQQTAASTCALLVFLEAWKELAAEGKLPGQPAPGDALPNEGLKSEFIDGMEFDASKPNAYLEALGAPHALAES